MGSFWFCRETDKFLKRGHKSQIMSHQMALYAKHADQRVLQNAMHGAADEISKSIGCALQCTIGATALNRFATVRTAHCIAHFNEKMEKKQVSIGRISVTSEMGSKCTISRIKSLCEGALCAFQCNGKM